MRPAGALHRWHPHLRDRPAADRGQQSLSEHLTREQEDRPHAATRQRDNALDTLIDRALIVHDPHHLFVTTRAISGPGGVEGSGRSARTQRSD
jgi:hypothetical protein